MMSFQWTVARPRFGTRVDPSWLGSFSTRPRPAFRSVPSRYRFIPGTLSPGFCCGELFSHTPKTQGLSRKIPLCFPTFSVSPRDQGITNTIDHTTPMAVTFVTAHFLSRRAGVSTQGCHHCGSMGGIRILSKHIYFRM